MSTQNNQKLQSSESIMEIASGLRKTLSAMGDSSSEMSRKVMESLQKIGDGHDVGRVIDLLNEGITTFSEGSKILNDHMVALGLKSLPDIQDVCTLATKYDPAVLHIRHLTKKVIKEKLEKETLSQKLQNQRELSKDIMEQPKRTEMPKDGLRDGEEENDKEMKDNDDDNGGRKGKDSEVQRCVMSLGDGPGCVDGLPPGDTNEICQKCRQARVDKVELLMSYRPDGKAKEKVASIWFDFRWSGDSSKICWNEQNDYKEIKIPLEERESRCKEVAEGEIYCDLCEKKRRDLGILEASL